MCESNYEGEERQTTEKSHVSLLLMFACHVYFIHCKVIFSSVFVCFFVLVNWLLVSSSFKVQGEPTHLFVADNRIQQFVYICGRLEKGSLQLREPRTWGHAVEGVCKAVVVHINTACHCFIELQFIKIKQWIVQSPVDHCILILITNVSHHIASYIFIAPVTEPVLHSGNKGVKLCDDLYLQLWDLLMPTVKLESRITKQWGDIGFQGDDPKTDFRGMGLLGLINLVWVSNE